VKTLKFVGNSLKELREFPEEVRRAAGFELRAIQNGLDPSDWKPMNIIGSGVKEVRIHLKGEWRVIYITKKSDAVYVLHAFKKKSQKTSSKDIELAKKRFKMIGDR
jgi:phage-related protein